MTCPSCKRKMLCNESRQVRGKQIRYRTYKCPTCGTKFATKEEKVDFEEAIHGISAVTQYLKKHPTPLPTTKNPIIPEYILQQQKNEYREVSHR